MNSSPAHSQGQKTSSAERVCARCGKTGAHQIGELAICEACYCEAGSCCAEFGADDLWKIREAAVEPSTAPRTSPFKP